MPVGALLAVFGLLPRRAAAVGTRDILLFLGLGLYLVLLFARTAATTEVNAVLQNLLEITLFAHSLISLMGPIGLMGLINGGTVVLP